MLTAAGALALVAGGRVADHHSQGGNDMALPSETIPDFVRVEALRGFRGHVDGRFVEVKKGEVVTVTKDLAIDLRMSQKAVMTDKPLTKSEHETTGGKGTGGDKKHTDHGHGK